MNGFILHPQLAADTLVVGDLELCRVLLMNEAQYPWLILVPRRDGIREIFELSAVEQSRLMQESSAVAAAMARHLNADKMNIAALGNIVPQLHIHHIARFENDPAWPAPVWGKLPRVAYAPDAAQRQLHIFRDLFGVK